jgi:hypothetical protein
MEHKTTRSSRQEHSYIQEEDFLTPEQRLEIVADVLSTIALRIIKKRHEKQDTGDK